MYHHLHKIPPLKLFLSQMKPLHTITAILLHSFRCLALIKKGKFVVMSFECIHRWNATRKFEIELQLLLSSRLFSVSTIHSGEFGAQASKKRPRPDRFLIVPTLLFLNPLKLTNGWQYSRILLSQCYLKFHKHRCVLSYPPNPD
jgi:hypothetical protein